MKIPLRTPATARNADDFTLSSRIGLVKVYGRIVSPLLQQGLDGSALGRE
jgi:hypothetical protein